jgi:hypothetical protein
MKALAVSHEPDVYGRTRRLGTWDQVYIARLKLSGPDGNKDQ